MWPAIDYFLHEQNEKTLTVQMLLQIIQSVYSLPTVIQNPAMFDVKAVVFETINTDALMISPSLCLPCALHFPVFSQLMKIALNVEQ